MNKIQTSRTLRERIADAIRAFQGKPVQTIQLGVRVVRCDECERGECELCAFKHEFETLMSLPNCNDCELNARNTCEHCPRPGEHIRINCPIHKPKEEGET